MKCVVQVLTYYNEGPSKSRARVDVLLLAKIRVVRNWYEKYYYKAVIS